MATQRMIMSQTTWVLLGPPGAGKSTVGPRVAAALGATCIDLDDAIAQHTGEPIDAVFAKGVTAFRALELFVLAAALKEQRSVVVAGGGIVDGVRARALLQRVPCVLLDIDANAAVMRLLRSTSRRPWLAGVGDALQTYVQREAPRRSLRDALARARVDASGDVIEVTAGVVSAWRALVSA